MTGIPEWIKRDASQLMIGKGSALWIYWTEGKGAALWTGAVHKWQTLNDLLKAAGVPGHMVDGLTTNIINQVLPGYMALAHKEGGKK